MLLFLSISLLWFLLLILLLYILSPSSCFQTSGSLPLLCSLSRYLPLCFPFSLSSIPLSPLSLSLFPTSHSFAVIACQRLARNVETYTYAKTYTYANTYTP